MAPFIHDRSLTRQPTADTLASGPRVESPAIRADFAESSETEPDGTAAAALIALTAFNGAAIGLLVCLTAVLQGDAGLALVACSGGTVCACAWWLNISNGTVP
jgi:hypothetical protein